ncbi:MAG: hypothetical protein Q7T44_01000 [Parvibaculum sp.]|nr:hypothetical protein [Parvibaculum sp.]
MPKYSAANTRQISAMTGDWNLYQAVFIGGFVGAAYIFVMFSLSHIISIRSMSFAVPLMLIAATSGATVALGIATLLNFVKRTERKRVVALDDLTHSALLRLA